MRNRVHYGLLIVAALFFTGFIANMVQGDAHPGDTPAQLAIVAVCIGGFAFVQAGERHRREFFEFLVANRDAIRAGTATYRGHAVSYATRVHTPHLVLGFLFVSFKLALRPVLVEERAPGLRIGTFVASILFGWWGLRALIWNIGTITDNLRSKPVVSIGELLEGDAVVNVPAARAS